jgi:hypothetical protein
MATQHSHDRSSEYIWLMLIIVGAFLMVVGWLRAAGWMG